MTHLLSRCTGILLLSNRFLVQQAHEYRPKLPTLALPDDCYDIIWERVSAEPSTDSESSTRVSIENERV